MERKNYIGGTDIGAILGLSPYKTPLQLWAEKTGKVPAADLSNNEAVQLGIELEDFVARKFAKITGLAVRRPPVSRYQDKTNPRFGCQVDRLIEGTDDLLEVKTASLRKDKEWEGDNIPAFYITQVMWQLMITGRQTGYIAVLIGGQRFLHKKIEADKDLFATMRARADEFLAMIDNDTPPMAMAGDDEVLLALHPKAGADLALMQDFEVAIARRQELSGQIDALKEEKELIEVQLKEVIANNAGIRTERYSVLWSQAKKTSVDTEKMKADGIYDQYAVKGETRRLTIKLNKGGK